MSRMETMSIERWRVTTMADDDVVHEVVFLDEAAARACYKATDCDGATKVLAVRRADEPRFETIVSQFMPNFTLWRMS